MTPTPGTDFYPRPPRGGRPTSAASRSVLSQFLSTPSARRATRVVGGEVAVTQISIHAVREEGDVLRNRTLQTALISIHALREEGDLPTRNGCSAISISIHALREEGDRAGREDAPRHEDFYPRPPRGGRPVTEGCAVMVGYFYPRPPRGGRRGTAYRRRWTGRFLSTPSARRATCCRWGSSPGCVYFYPRPPRGGRLFFC